MPPGKYLKTTLNPLTKKYALDSFVSNYKDLKMNGRHDATVGSSRTVVVGVTSQK